MQNYHSLSRRNENVKETKQCMVAVRELAANSHHALCTQRCELLNQLHQIFYIDQVCAELDYLVLNDVLSLSIYVYLFHETSVFAKILGDHSTSTARVTPITL